MHAGRRSVVGGSRHARLLTLVAVVALLAATLALPVTSRAETASEDQDGSEQTVDGIEDGEGGIEGGEEQLDDGEPEGDVDGEPGDDGEAEDEPTEPGEPGDEPTEPDGGEPDDAEPGDGGSTESGDDESDAPSDGDTEAPEEEPVTSLSGTSALTVSVGGTPLTFSGLVAEQDIVDTAAIVATGVTVTYDNPGACAAIVSVTTSDPIGPFLLRVSFDGEQSGVTALADGPATVGAGERSSPGIVRVAAGSAAEGLPLTYRLFTSVAGDPDLGPPRVPAAGTISLQLTFTITEDC